MFVYILVLLLIALYFALRWKHRKFYQLSKVLGSSSVSLPFSGVAHLFAGGGEVIMRGIETLGRDVLKKNGSMAAWMAHRFFVVIADPVLLDHVSKSCLEKHDIMSKCTGLVLGSSSLIAPVPIWRTHRRMLTPTFSSKHIKEYLNVFAEQSNVFVEKVKPLLNTPIPIVKLYKKYTMEALCQTTLGVQLDVQRQTSQHPFITGLELGTHLIGERFLQPWLYSDFIYKFLPCYKTLKQLRKYGDHFLDKIINSLRRHNREIDPDTNNLKQKSKSLMELLVEASENNKGISNHEMREEALGVALAGTDTTAISAGYISYLLANHPHVQENVLKELIEVFENQEPLTPEELSRLNYLDAVIKETLRLYPPVPIIVRQVEEDCELPSGVVLPKGCGILLHLWAINRNPAYWGADAEEFRPERFLDSSLQHPAQLATFSFGPRNCIGKAYAMTSLKALFATILRHFRFAPASGSGPNTEQTAHGLRLSYAVTMQDVNNCPVQLQMRNL